MVEQKWEYCSVTVVTERGELGERLEEVLCVAFASGADYPQVLIEDPERKGKVRLFHEALGRLGAAGWELVSVQNGTLSEPAIEPNKVAGTAQVEVNLGQAMAYRSASLIWGSVIGFLKRPVAEGRPVNDCQLG